MQYRSRSSAVMVVKGHAQAESAPLRLLDRVCECCRVRHYNRRTERAYAGTRYPIAGW